MRKVKVGYQLDFRNPPGSTLSFRDLYRESLAQVEAAERLGFDSIWLTEHHFTDDGYLPALMPAAAAIAARTTRVTIGTYVLLAPFYHPLKLAEDAAFVDVVSGGRLAAWDRSRLPCRGVRRLRRPARAATRPYARDHRDSETRVDRRTIQLRRQVFQVPRRARAASTGKPAASRTTVGSRCGQLDTASSRARSRICMRRRAQGNRHLSRGAEGRRQGQLRTTASSTAAWFTSPTARIKRGATPATR